MSFGSKGSQNAGPSGNVPDVLYSGVTSSPFGAAPDVGGISTGQGPYGGLEGGGMSNGQGPYGGLEERPFPSTGSSTSYDPTPYRSAVAQAISDPSNLSASLQGGTIAGGGNWNHVIGSEFGEVDNPKYGGYTEPNWNKGAWGDNLAGWDAKGVALPNVPHGTVVQVLNPATGQSTYAKVVDKGPGASTGAGIDLLAGTRNDLGLGRNFKGPVQYRIIGGPGTPMPAAQAVAVSPPQPPQALTQPQQQPQKKPAAQGQRQRRRPWRRVAGITPSFRSTPAELDFLRQALGGLPYQASAEPAQSQSDQTDQTS